MSTLHSALSLAAKGFKVFPVPFNRKQATLKNWPELATTDEVKIRERWTSAIGGEEDHNIGVCCDDLLVIDIEGAAKTAVDPLDVLARIEAETGKLHHLVLTPSGGYHAYLRLPKGVRVSNTSKTLWPTVDTRSYHGYVLGAGSSVDGKPYTWVESIDGDVIPASIADLPLAPDSLISRSGKPRDAAPLDPSIEWDTPTAITLATTYLKMDAPAAALGGRGSTAYKVACRLRDYAVSENQTLLLMHEHWNVEGRVDPPMPVEDLVESVDHAYRYAKGSASPPGAEFDVVDGVGQGATLTKPPDNAKAKITLLSFDDLAGKALEGKSNYLVKGFIDENTVSMFTGESTAGKSFVAMDLAWSVATGNTFAGRDVHRGYVAYFVLEGGGGVKKRLAALRKNRPIDSPVAADFSVSPINLFASGADTKAIIYLVRERASHYGLPPKLIIFDTAARSMAGGDENSAEDVMVLLANAEAIRAALGIHVMFVHHPGKDASKGERGSVVFQTNVDTRIRITKLKPPTDRSPEIRGAGRIEILKQKDGEDGVFADYLLHRCEIGVTDDLETVDSLVVEYLPALALEKPKGKSRVKREELGDGAAERVPYSDLAVALADAYEAKGIEIGSRIELSSIQNAAALCAGVPDKRDGPFKAALQAWGKNVAVIAGEGRWIEITKGAGGSPRNYITMRRAEKMEADDIAGSGAYQSPNGAG